MRIVVNVHMFAAGLLVPLGVGAVGLAAVGTLSRGAAWVGITAVLLGGAAYVVARFETYHQDMAEREQAAYDFGRLVSVPRSRPFTNGTIHPSQRS